MVLKTNSPIKGPNGRQRKVDLWWFKHYWWTNTEGKQKRTTFFSNNKGKTWETLQILGPMNQLQQEFQATYNARTCSWLSCIKLPGRRLIMGWCREETYVENQISEYAWYDFYFFADHFKGFCSYVGPREMAMSCQRFPSSSGGVAGNRAWT